MKHSIFTILSLTVLFAASCSKDDAPAEVQLAFAGKYKANKHMVTFKSLESGDEDNTFKDTVFAGAAITIKLIQSSPKQIEIQLDDLLKDIFLILSVDGYTFDFDKNPTALVSGNFFELKRSDFKIKNSVHVLAECSIEGEGSINENSVWLKYEILYKNSHDHAKLTGEVELKKEN